MMISCPTRTKNLKWFLTFMFVLILRIWLSVVSELRNFKGSQYILCIQKWPEPFNKQKTTYIPAYLKIRHTEKASKI